QHLVPEPVTSVHDRPSAGEIVEAVREWIEQLHLQGHDAFLARVSSRVLKIVERELASPDLERRHRDRLDGLGVRDDAELAAQVREGRDDAATVAAIRESVIDKLSIADPRLLQR
ncbi:MAG TPA: DUF6285 domain-containing protein, partial [Mycobacteriales bacterium]|nr:DUF6285 domain-containing protein [Mycobacteriales bacterium]